MDVVEKESALAEFGQNGVDLGAMEEAPAEEALVVEEPTVADDAAPADMAEAVEAATDAPAEAADEA